MKLRVASLFILAGTLVLTGFYQASRGPAAPLDPTIEAFKKSTVASVADAVDQVTGQRGFMGHDMRPYVGIRFVGRARTSLVKPATPEQSVPALSTKHSVEMIENAQPGEVGVIVMEGSLDVAAMGGLMGTAAKSRGIAGMVLDGAVRDIAELRGLGLPVFARSASPATAVGRYATVGRDHPVALARSGRGDRHGRVRVRALPLAEFTLRRMYERD